MNKLMVIGILSISFYLTNCTNPVAGGSSDHGNAYAGIAMKSEGKPAANTLVRILPDDYNHATDSTKAYRETYADSEGHFHFDSLPDGTYCISGKDSWSGKGFVKKRVRLENNRMMSDSIFLDYEGSIYIDNADSLGLNKDMIVILPGLPLSVRIDSTCVVRIQNIPPGLVHIIGFDPRSRQLMPIFLPGPTPSDSIEIISTKTLLLPSRSPMPFYVSSAFTFHRTLEGEVDRSYLFSAVEPTKPLDNSYSYRFWWGDGQTSKWSEKASMEHTWNKPGTYLVQCQTMWQNTYNAWSDYITVIIK